MLNFTDYSPNRGQGTLRKKPGQTVDTGFLAAGSSGGPRGSAAGGGILNNPQQPNQFQQNGMGGNHGNTFIPNNPNTPGSSPAGPPPTAPPPIAPPIQKPPTQTYPQQPPQTTLPPGPGQPPAGYPNFLNQSLQGLSDLAASGGPIDANVQNILRQQARDSTATDMQGALRAMREQYGARGLGGSGLQQRQDLMTRLGAANAYTQANNQIGLDAANQNWNARLGANNALNAGSLAAGRFGNDVYQQNRNFDLQNILAQHGMGMDNAQFDFQRIMAEYGLADQGETRNDNIWDQMGENLEGQDQQTQNWLNDLINYQSSWYSPAQQYHIT